MLKIQPR